MVLDASRVRNAGEASNKYGRIASCYAVIAMLRSSGGCNCMVLGDASSASSSAVSLVVLLVVLVLDTIVVVAVFVVSSSSEPAPL